MPELTAAHIEAVSPENVATAPETAAETVANDKPATAADKAAFPRKRGRPQVVYGRAVVYGPWSTPVPADRPGTFNRFRLAPNSFSPDPAGVVAHYSHDGKTLIGSTENKSLELEQDGHGVNFTMKLPKTSEGKKTYHLVKQQYLSSMSPGIDIIEARKVKTDENINYIEVTKFKLREISPTPKPAYQGTWISNKKTGFEDRTKIVTDAQNEMKAELKRQSELQRQQIQRIGLKNRNMMNG